MFKNIGLSILTHWTTLIIVFILAYFTPVWFLAFGMGIWGLIVLSSPIAFLIRIKKQSISESVIATIFFLFSIIFFWLLTDTIFDTPFLYFEGAS